MAMDFAPELIHPSRYIELSWRARHATASATVSIAILKALPGAFPIELIFTFSQSYLSPIPLEDTD